jgi:ABC-2 type transport system permease protein
VASLIGAEMRRIFVQTRRYPTEFASSTIVLFLVFLGLFLGASYLSGVAIHGPHLSMVVLGYLVWMLSLTATGDMGFELQNEAQNGTLEQVFLTPRPTGLIMLVRDAVSVAFYLIPMAAVLTLLLLVTGARLAVSPADAVPAALAILSAWGMGLVVASGAILFKRMNQALNLLQFLLLFVIMAPIARLSGLWHVAATALPLAAAVGLLDHLMVGGGPSTAVLMGEAAANAAVWLAGGLWLFSRADRLARERGILAHY